MSAGFVLASASPRRRDLLESAGWSPEIVPQDIDESPHPDERPIPYVRRIALAKAEAAGKGALPVLAADTVVALDGQIMTKAKDEKDAISLLTRLAGRAHNVHTAVVLSCPDGRRYQRLVSTEVRFRALSQEEISRYVDSRESMDKAGAYGIQGRGGALVADVRGSYTNVVGLPLEETLGMLSLAGVGE